MIAKHDGAAGELLRILGVRQIGVISRTRSDRLGPLIASGPFAYVRNPLYLGTLIAAAGFALASRSWWLAGVFTVVFALVYLPVIELEEQHLRKLFPSYEDYCERVPMLLPHWRKAQAKRRFRWLVYRRNEEYNALLGFLAGTAVLLWKALR